MAYIEVDIDVDEFYDNLSNWEKDELVEKLIKDGYGMKDPNMEYEDEEDKYEGSPVDHEWYAMINKINQSRYQLTDEQEQLLTDLAKSL